MNHLLGFVLAATLFAQFGWAQAQYVDDVVSFGPLGYWRLNGNASDSTAFGNNGTLINGVTFTGPGGGAPIGDPNSQAAVFDIAEDQYISIPVPATLFPLDWNQPLTMMIWLKTTHTSSNMILLAKEENRGNYRGPYLAIDNGDTGSAPKGAGRFAMSLFATATNGTFTSGNDLTVESFTPVNDGNWHFLVATYDGSGLARGIQLYIDGSATNTFTFADSLNGLTTLNNVPVTIGSRDMGALPCDGRLSEAAIFAFALTPGQIQQLENDTLVSSSILPQFAFGGGWYSALYFTNTGAATVSFTVNFMADNGSPLTVPSLGGSSTTLTLAPRATALIEAPNTGALTQGYVSLLLPAGVEGYGVYRSSAPGRAGQEAVVPLAGTSSKISTLIWDDANLETAVAIVNPSSVSTVVSIVVRDPAGNVIGTSSVSLGANSKTAVILRSLSGLAAMAGKRGSADFTVTTGSVAVLGLRADGPAITSIPAAQR